MKSFSLRHMIALPLLILAAAVILASAGGAGSASRRGWGWGRPLKSGTLSVFRLTFPVQCQMHSHLPIPYLEPRIFCAGIQFLKHTISTFLTRLFQVAMETTQTILTATFQ